MLQVRVTGSPAPSLSWYCNDEEVTEDCSLVPRLYRVQAERDKAWERGYEDCSLSLAQDGTLTIPSAEPRHSGAYRVTVLGDEEPNPLVSKVAFRPIPLPEFGECVAVNHTNSDHGFMEQYKVTDYECIHSSHTYYFCLSLYRTLLQALESGSEHLMTIGMSSTNKKKNRFKNMAVCEFAPLTAEGI